MPQVRTVKYVADTKEAVDGVKKLSKEEKKAADARKKQLAEQKKEQQALIDSIGVFGMTIGGLKQNLKGMATAGSIAFKTIGRAAIASGIGAVVVAFGSLMTFLTKTKKGAEILETAMAALGATFTVIVDRVSQFGKGLVGLFTGKGKQGLKDMLGSFKGIGEEIKNDVKLMTDLSKATIALRDSTRELNVETAKQRAEVEALKLIAEDRTKGEAERLEAAEKAFAIEQELLDKRVENAAEAVRIQKETMDASENTAEDLDRLAELEINLFNIQQESGTKQIELNNKINAIKQETINKIKQEEQAEKDKIKAVADAQKQADADIAKITAESDKKREEAAEGFQEVLDRNLTPAQKAAKQIEENFAAMEKTVRDGVMTGAVDAMEAIEQFSALAREKREAVQASNEAFLEADIDFLMQAMGKNAEFIESKTAEEISLIAHKSRIEREDAVKTAQIRDAAIQSGLSATQSVVGGIGGLLKEGTKGAKAAAMADILINTAKGISSAIAGATAAAAGTGPAAIFTQPLFLAQMIGTVLSGIASAKGILGKVPGGGGGGGGPESVSVEAGGPANRGGIGGDLIPNIEGVTGAISTAPAMPVQAYVVENDISNSQALQSELDAQSTL
tara:strand:+ start:5907 stop:7769 length:1863 start_codon:yes stop_codon:yes gene_type:complete